MYSELTNLVPTKQRKSFRAEYFIRLATVAVLFVVVLVIAQGVFLLPSYLYEGVVITSRTQELQKLSALIGSMPEQEAHSQMQALGAESTYLLGMQKAGTASTALRAVLAVPHKGIIISGLTFQQSTPIIPNRTILLTGVAATRDELRGYSTALSALPFVTNVDLPVSSYAKDTSLPFTITLTGTLQP